MEICIKSGKSVWAADAVGVMLFEDEQLEDIYGELLEACPWIRNSPVLMDRKGKKNEVLVAYGPVTSSIPRVIFIGLGKKEKLTLITMLDAIRNGTASFSAYCRRLGLKDIAVPVTPLARFNPNLERVVTEVVCASFLSLYTNKEYKSKLEDEDGANEIGSFSLLFSEESPSEKAVAAANCGKIQAQGVIRARVLSNMPGNVLTPIKMEEEAKKIAEKYGMQCKSFDRQDIIQEGMGAFASVAAGSVQEPRLIILEYAPDKCKSEDPLVFVGKGITFDSGGISIKPASNMWEMKGDMSGAGALLGLFEVLGELQPAVRVIALLACAENMPDGCASRPGDVVRAFNGKTIEIVNTDAEGRLVLCDAMAYAQKMWNPKVLIDVATLTGACVVALGDDVAGIFSEQKDLVEQIVNIGDVIGEPFWSLPVHDRYFESLKSETGDFTNAGSRAGGASSAAVFLKQFVEPGVPWVHLDVAGPCFIAKKNPLCPAGGTGFSVRTCVEFILQFYENK